MSRISRNIALILRAERMIAVRHLAVLRNQSGLVAYAGLIGVVGLVMLNVAFFFALSEHTSSSWAALIVSVFNFVVAGVILFFASRMNAEHSLEGVVELRDLAMEDIENEVGDLVGEAKDLSDNVRKMARDPLGSFLPSLIGPLIASLISASRKKDD